MTVAELEVSPATFDEITRLLRAAGYDHALHLGGVDLSGIQLVRGPEHPVDDRAAFEAALLAANDGHEDPHLLLHRKGNVYRSVRAEAAHQGWQWRARWNPEGGPSHE